MSSPKKRKEPPSQSTSQLKRFKLANEADVIPPVFARFPSTIPQNIESSKFDLYAENGDIKGKTVLVTEQGGIEWVGEKETEGFT
jgi:hypothetical protein